MRGWAFFVLTRESENMKGASTCRCTQQAFDKIAVELNSSQESPNIQNILVLLPEEITDYSYYYFDFQSHYLLSNYILSQVGVITKHNI